MKSGEDNNLRFDKLPNNGVSDFTLAMNVTNMTNADLILTFPALQGLRIAGYSMQDDAVDLVEGQDYTAPVQEFLPDGRLRVHQEVDYDKSNWPVGRNLFIDFTTSEPESNDIPEWTAFKPANNSVIGVMTGMEYMAVSADELSDWATDSNGWALDCNFASNGWSASQDEDGNMYVTSPAGSTSTTATCGIVDPFGAMAVETLDFTFGQPFSGSASITDGENIDFQINPTGLLAEITVEAHAHQTQGMGDIRSSLVSNQAVTISLPMNNLRPGAVMIMGQATGTNMLPFSFMLDYGLEKESLPPTITLRQSFDGSNATWDAGGLQFTLKGTVIEPDGEDITMVLELCGSQATDFTKVGDNWEIDVSIATCVMQDIEVYDVKIIVTDESGTVGTLEANIPDPNAEDTTQDNSDTSDDSSGEESSGLPGVSMIATICVTLLGAAFARRKLEE